MDQIPEYRLKDKPDPGIPLTVDNWMPYWQLEMDYDTSIMTGYLMSSDRDATGLEKIVNSANSFDELKSEILKFIQERKDFYKDVTDKWDGPNPERWGFPS